MPQFRKVCHAMPKVCSVSHDGRNPRNADKAFLRRIFDGHLPRRGRSIIWSLWNKTKVLTRLQTTSTVQLASLLHIFFRIDPGHQVQALQGRKDKLFLKRKRSRWRPLFLQTKWKFFQALFPTAVDPVEMRARPGFQANFRLRPGIIATRQSDAVGSRRS